MSKLPDTCFTYVKSENEIGMIKCGETGYYPVKLKNSGTFTEHPQDIVDRMNHELGATHAEVMAMESVLCLDGMYRAQIQIVGRR